MVHDNLNAWERRDGESEAPLSPDELRAAIEAALEAARTTGPGVSLAEAARRRMIARNGGRAATTPTSEPTRTDGVRRYRVDGGGGQGSDGAVLLGYEADLRTEHGR